jgi:hypothetical protein
MSKKQNNQYTEHQIDCSSWFDEGGYCQFYPIKGHSFLGFKEFRSKRKANYSRSVQKELSKFDLAPKIYSPVCKLKFFDRDDPDYDCISDWGYVTEVAEDIQPKKLSLAKIQNLVNEIYEKSGLKFWDCHYYNIGLVDRNNTQKLVCIDTGKESFDGYANAWGFAEPGPKCSYCNKYQCRCSE